MGTKADVDHPKFSSVQELLDSIDVAVSSAPEYNTSGLVGFPVNALLYYVMATPAGMKMSISRIYRKNSRLTSKLSINHLLFIQAMLAFVILKSTLNSNIS